MEFKDVKQLSNSEIAIYKETLKNESETTEINETNNTNNENEKGEN